MLGHPGLAEGHIACWGQTEAQENSASPTELASHLLHYQVCFSEKSVWTLQLLPSSLLKSSASLCCCPPPPPPKTHTS